MEKSKLAQARAQKGWTLKQASDAVGTSPVTFSRWEQGHQQPYGYNLERLCEAFDISSEELGFGIECVEGVSIPIHSLVGKDLTLQLLTVAFIPQQHFEAVQNRITLILEEYDAMHEENMSRREALARLASLPLIASLRPDVANARSEDIITQCAASIAACWELSKSSYEEDLHRAFDTASTFISALKRIAQDSSRYRKDAVLLIGQCSLLKTVLGWHLQGVREAAVYAKDAILYAREANDITLQVSAMDYLCWALYYDNRTKLAEQTAARARALIKQHEAILPPLLCSGVYSTYAVMQAKNGGKASATFDEACQYFVTSRQREPLKFIYMDYTKSALVLNDGMIHYFAGEQSEAMKAFEQIVDPKDLATKLQIPGRSKVETLNFMAMSSLKQKDKDIEETLHYWKAAVQGATALQSEQRFNETLLTYEIMDAVWPNEKRVKELRDLAMHW